ncbi:MAG: ECF-type sigma factor [Planctomycetota bacterium]
MAAEESVDAPSVTEWLEEVKAGQEGEPQQQLVDRFLHRLEGLARARLKSGALDDEQDVALSAMNSFLMRAPQRSYPWLTDRESLWSLLAAITINKVLTVQRKGLAKKRDQRRQVSLDEAMHVGDPDLLSSVCGEGTRLLESLGDDGLRQIALMRMEGYRNKEIAEKIECSEKTVERKLALIRKQFRAELDD